MSLIEKIQDGEATNEMVAKFLGIEQEFGYMAGKRSPVKHYHDFPDWLGNTDIALSLVPDGLDFYIEHSASGRWRFYKHIKNGDFKMMSICKAPQLAIIIALIKMEELKLLHVPQQTGEENG